MDMRLTKEEMAFREEVRAFFRTALPKDLRHKMELGLRYTADDLRAWHCILDDKGWVAPLWAPEWGGTNWNAVQQYIFKEELQLAPAPDPLGQNINLVGPVIIAFGTEEQKKFFLPKVRRLDIWFCQGFSEPGAGSDLAALKMRAVRDGDHYVLNGQKVWTSQAHRSNWMFGLVRTDPDAKKQKGITYLLIDMKTPGIEVRPIITLDGDHYTNEVFFDNVRVPVANRIGEENKGWDYAKFLLGNERLGIARVGHSKHRIRRAKQLAAGINDGDRPLSESPRFREKLAMMEVELKALEMTNMRLVADMRKKGGGAGTIGPVLKLKGSELVQATTEALLDVAGPDSWPRQTPFVRGEPSAEPLIGPDWAAATAPNYFFSRAATIYGGTTEIQHNILAKASLGL
jgi:alkylation response protein AidB-like acyl-CoA dehydrogenase